MKLAAPPPKFKTMVAGRGGWCEWIFPQPKKNYLMKCCDWFGYAACCQEPRR